MCFLVVSERGKNLGYLVDGIYFKRSIAQYFISRNLQPNGVVLGKPYKDSILVDNIEYIGVLDALNKRSLVEIVCDINIKFNDIVFVPRSVLDLDCEGVSDFWKVASDFTKGKNMYECFDNNGKSLAYLSTRYDLYRDCMIYINMFEVFKKSRGNGTRIVNQLKSFNKPISGFAVISAMDFWKQQGAEFQESRGYFTI